MSWIRWWGGTPGETPNDTLSIGRLSIHVCGPWDYGAPPRLHISWHKKGWDDFPDKGNRWHLALALTPSGRFSRPLHRPGRPTWTYFSTPTRAARSRQAYQEWKARHPSP